jgi:hypothetical protein
MISPSCWTLTVARCARNRSTRTPGNQIGANLGLGHGFGVTFAVKENEPADPSDVP